MSCRTGIYQMINGDVVSHLNVSQARTKYGGTYECRASSKVGVVTHSAKLNVLGAPFVKRMRPAKVLIGVVRTRTLIKKDEKIMLNVHIPLVYIVN